MAALAEVEAADRLQDTLDSSEWPYRFDVIPHKQMMVDVYQRPLTSFADEIAKAFDPALVGTIVLSQRTKTRFAVIDGQTRVEGAKRAGIAALPAIVYEGLSFEQEADLFAKFQTQRRGMHSVHRFMAQVHAKHETPVAVNAIVESMGFRVSENPGDDRRGIPSPAALEWIYNGATVGARKKVPSPELLEQVLEVISEAWPKQPAEARSAVMLRGLGHFIKTAQAKSEGVDIGRLIERLQQVQPSELSRRAASLREGHGMSANSPKYMSEAIESQYLRMRGR